MAKHILLSFLFLMLCFFSNAQQIKSGYGLQKKNWAKTKATIIFCGKEEGFVLLDSLLLKPTIFVAPPYFLNSLSFNFSGSGWVNPFLTGLMLSNSSINSNTVDLKFVKKAFDKCKDGTKIGLVNIKVKKDNIIYDVPDIIFTVKENL
jgi:hypothetical protein